MGHDGTGSGEPVPINSTPTCAPAPGLPCARTAKWKLHLAVAPQNRNSKMDPWEVEWAQTCGLPLLVFF